jgi:hypothetical protein
MGSSCSSVVKWDKINGNGKRPRVHHPAQANLKKGRALILKWSPVSGGQGILTALLSANVNGLFASRLLVTR